MCVCVCALEEQWKRECVCVCVCRPVCLPLFPKEVSLYNKHSHSSSPADLINKTRSPACSTHSHTLTLTPPFPHITGEHQKLSAHETTRFHVSGGKQARQKAEKTCCNRSQPQFKPPKPSNLFNRSQQRSHTCTQINFKSSYRSGDTSYLPCFNTAVHVVAAVVFLTYSDGVEGNTSEGFNVITSS